MGESVVSCGVSEAGSPKKSPLEESPSERWVGALTAEAELEAVFAGLLRVDSWVPRQLESAVGMAG